jgi:hypothetical protein
MTQGRNDRGLRPAMTAMTGHSVIDAKRGHFVIGGRSTSKE